LVLRAEIDLFAGGGVLAIENASRPKHDKLLFHKYFSEHANRSKTGRALQAAFCCLKM
jgi:16S rRNA G966 N2-methylase RsmD